MQQKEKFKYFNFFKLQIPEKEKEKMKKKELKKSVPFHVMEYHYGIIFCGNDFSPFSRILAILTKLSPGEDFT